MKTKPKYFEFEVSGINEAEVKRRVAEHVERGAEIIGSKCTSSTHSNYDYSESIGRSKQKFAGREEREKFTTRLRKVSTKC